MSKSLNLSKKSFFWLLLGLVVFIPLYPKFPLVNVPGTYVAIRFEDFFIGFIGIYWIFINHKKIKKFFNETIFQSFILFWSIGVLSLLSAILITQSISPHLGLLHLLRRVEYMSLFIIAATSISSVAQIKTILKFLLVTTIVVVIYGFGQQWLNFPVVSTTNREFSKGLILFLTPGARVNSTFAGHYDLAVFLSLIIVLISSLFFYYKGIFLKLLLTVSGLLSFGLLGLTAARISFVATILGISICLWLNNKKILIVVLMVLALGTVALIPDLRHRLVATLTVNLLGGGGPKYEVDPNLELNSSGFISESSRAALLKQATQSSQSSNLETATVAADIAPGEPINPTELGVYRSFGIRFDVEWPRALRAFYKNPILGTGYSSLNLATDNDILRSLGEVGILGTLALFLIFIILFKVILKFVKNNAGFERFFIVGIFGMLIAFLVTGSFIDVFESSKVAIIFWFLLGVGWAVMKDYKYNE